MIRYLDLVEYFWLGEQVTGVDVAPPDVDHAERAVIAVAAGQ